MSKPIKIAILGDTKDFGSNLDRAQAKLNDTARTADKAGDKIDSSFGGAADAADELGGKSSQAAGGLGDLGGALALMPGPLGAVGAGMEAAAPAIMGVTGAADLMNLAMNSSIITTTKAKVATIGKTVADKAAAAGSKAMAAAQWLVNAAMSANPIGLIIVGLVALAAGLIVAYKKSQTFRDIVHGAFAVVRRAAGAVASFFTTKIPAAFNKVREAAGKAIGWVKSNWPKLLAIITGPIGLAVLAVTSQWGKIKAGATAAKDWVTSKFNALVGFAVGLPGRMGRALSGLFDGLKDAFRGALNFVIDKWNGFELKVKLPKILGGGEIGIGTPDIPRLARGGITTGPTMAMIGDNPGGREAVIPLDRYDLSGGEIVTLLKAIRDALQTGASIDYDRLARALAARPLAITQQIGSRQLATLHVAGKAAAEAMA